MRVGPWRKLLQLHSLVEHSLAPESSSSVVAPPPALHAKPASDSEAEAVQAWAEARASSEEEEMQPAPCAADFSDYEAEQLQLRVCNGPWSSLHRLTESSTHVFLESDSTDVHLLKSACGCKLSVAAMFVWTSNLHNACTRKGGA